jgi:hypothetical protein
VTRERLDEAPCQGKVQAAACDAVEAHLLHTVSAPLIHSFIQSPRGNANLRWIKRSALATG